MRAARAPTAGPSPPPRARSRRASPRLGHVPAAHARLHQLRRGRQVRVADAELGQRAALLLEALHRRPEASQAELQLAERVERPDREEARGRAAPAQRQRLVGGGPAELRLALARLERRLPAERGAQRHRLVGLARQRDRLLVERPADGPAIARRGVAAGERERKGQRARARPGRAPPRSPARSATRPRPPRAATSGPSAAADSVRGLAGEHVRRLQDRHRRRARAARPRRPRRRRSARCRAPGWRRSARARRAPSASSSWARRAGGSIASGRPA